MVQDWWERWLGVHNDIPHDLSISKPCEGILDAFLASPVKGTWHSVI